MCRFRKKGAFSSRQKAFQNKTDGAEEGMTNSEAEKARLRRARFAVCRHFHSAAPAYFEKPPVARRKRLTIGIAKPPLFTLQHPQKRFPSIHRRAERNFQSKHKSWARPSGEIPGLRPVCSAPIPPAAARGSPRTTSPPQSGAGAAPAAPPHGRSPRSACRRPDGGAPPAPALPPGCPASRSPRQ